MTSHALAVGSCESAEEVVSDSSTSDDCKDKVCLAQFSTTTVNKHRRDDARCRS